MKTIPENLAAIIEAVKPTKNGYTLLCRPTPYTHPDADYYWHKRHPGGGETECYRDEADAYAACVVALLGRCEPYVGLYTSEGGKFAVEYNDVCQTDGYDDPLSALYAAFVARPDLFGEAK